jgi:hypothetical protein
VLFATSLYLLEAPPEPLGRWLGRKLGRLTEGRFSRVVVATAVLSARYWMDNVGYGHVNAVLWALSLLGVYFALRRRPGGGALLGAAVATKLITAPVLAYLFVKRRWAAVVVALVVAAVLLVGPAAALGWERNVELFKDWYVKVVRSSMVESYYLGYDYNMSLHSLIYVYARWLSGAADRLTLYRPAWFPYVRWAVTLLFVAPFFFPYLRRRKPRGAADAAAIGGLQLSIIIIAGVLLSPASWPSHFVATVFPYMAALYVLREAASRSARVACYVLLALSFIAHSLTSGDIWGAAMREAFYDLKCITWATLLLYAAIVVLLLSPRSARSAAVAGATARPGK